MANSIISLIGMNDSLENVIRKCNDNFRRISYFVSENSNNGIRREANRANSYSNEITSQAISKLDDDIQHRLDGIVDEVNRLSVIDAELSSTSDNAVQNKAIKAAIDELNDSLSKIDERLKKLEMQG